MCSAAERTPTTEAPRPSGPSLVAAEGLKFRTMLEKASLRRTNASLCSARLTISLNTLPSKAPAMAQRTRAPRHGFHDFPVEPIQAVLWRCCYCRGGRKLQLCSEAFSSLFWGGWQLLSTSSAAVPPGLSPSLAAFTLPAAPHAGPMLPWMFLFLNPEKVAPASVFQQLTSSLCSRAFLPQPSACCLQVDPLPISIPELSFY